MYVVKVKFTQYFVCVSLFHRDFNQQVLLRILFTFLIFVYAP